MRVVLYDTRLDPITVLNLDSWAVKMLRDGQHFHIAVPPDIANLQRAAADFFNEACLQKFNVVTIWFEPFRRGDAVSWIALTKYGDLALHLRAAFLPGQTGEVYKRQRESFLKGVMLSIAESKP